MSKRHLRSGQCLSQGWPSLSPGLLSERAMPFITSACYLMPRASLAICGRSRRSLAQMDARVHARYGEPGKLAKCL